MNINDYTPYREGTHSQFTSKEKRCTHIINNPNRKYIRQYKVDGGIFPAGQMPKRCDYLILNDTEHHSYYIELKGSDIHTAIDQIESSIRSLCSQISDYSIKCRIVYRTSTQELHDDYVLKWKRRRQAIIKSICLEETI